MAKSRYVCSVFLIWLSTILTAPAGDWTTVGGNNQRNGQSDETGPATNQLLWSKPSLNSVWGNQVYTWGDKLVTTRYTSLSPLRAPLACHNLYTGDTLWTRNYAPNGVMIVMGFHNDQIYARNFQQGGADSIYAINPADGAVIWKSNFTVERGIIWSAVFAGNGDLIVPGSGNLSIMRIDHADGDTVWTLTRTIPNTGAESMCAIGNTLYAWEGAINTPKRLMAIDINSGAVKYYSPALPGDGDQEITFSLGPDGVIYCARDGGLIYALEDNGSALEIRWSAPPRGTIGTYAQFGVGPDNSVYIPMGKRLYRLDALTGAALDSSVEVIGSGVANGRMAIGADGMVYFGNGASEPAQGKYFMFSPDLQEVFWSQNVSFNYYSGPALGRDGILVFGGSGATLYAYQTPTAISPQPAALVEGFSLAQNYPNPFNPVTTIPFTLPKAANVTLVIYNSAGQPIRTLVSGNLSAGRHLLQWDGTDGAGKPVASGVYLYRLKADNFKEARKMTLVQ